MELRSKDLAQHFLFPSSLWVGKEPNHVQTILGSCVAVCLFDTVLLQGGINHYMLPWWTGKGIPSPKYGDVAIELLIEKMFAMGSLKHNLVAKVFGGASQITNGPSVMEIGLRNIETAEKLLAQYQIKIVSKSVGGPVGRKIVFNTSTGQVMMKQLNSINQTNNEMAIKRP